MRRAYLWAAGWALGLALVAYLWAVRPILELGRWLDEWEAGDRGGRRR